MKEIRLTVRADDFAAASQALIAVGVGFRVEPVDEAPPEAAATGPAPQPVLKRRAAKKVAKAPARKPSRGEIPITGADRLRTALARRQPDLAPANPSPDAAEAGRPPSGDNGM